jgi:predicted DNA-binding transcriptional regulator AlpA
MNDEAQGLVLINATQFMAKLGIRATSRFYQLAKTDPRFPKAIKRGPKYSRYVLTEADAYIRELIRERDQQPVAA